MDTLADTLIDTLSAKAVDISDTLSIRLLDTMRLVVVEPATVAGNSIDLPSWAVAIGTAALALATIWLIVSTIKWNKRNERMRVLPWLTLEIEQKPPEALQLPCSYELRFINIGLGPVVSILIKKAKYYKGDYSFEIEEDFAVLKPIGVMCSEVVKLRISQKESEAKYGSGYFDIIIHALGLLDQLVIFLFRLSFDGKELRWEIPDYWIRHYKGKALKKGI